MSCPYPHSREMNEKGTSSSTASSELNEKTYPSIIPDASLPCLAKDYNPVHLQNIVKEFILLATGGVAILLQVANPGVGAGVNENSNFAYRPSDRLRTTMTYVYCMAFGTPQERAAIIKTVHQAHVPVRGPGYEADDPDLQLWVAATLYACGTDIYEKIFGKLDPAEADAVYQEYSVIGTSLRVPPEMWPKTRQEFWAYWDEKIETMEVTPHAKNVAKDLLYNTHGPLWLRLNLPFVRVLTAEWLPPRMRAEYGLKTSKPRRALYKAAMGYGKFVIPLLPAFVRQYPRHYYLKDMRKRMKMMGEV
jgi:uncharacterized protein (DUF2236 family)